ncbi:uncharacterized protein LOC126897260 [Daktulosphaira vitifoliae]|uniref:uncharacterized protein LOC126897260 n=1 Tax=Daktulosphaira vitifoliae TaxID=58002 RepID=UPI0021AA38E0|nr:uncharacterized protein LOC126897260 [Daktulosphaira vitifoliae]
MSDSSSIITTAHGRRKYMDPWDLDLREVSWRHSSDTTDCSADQVVSLSSAAGPESTRSDFIYVPGRRTRVKSRAHSDIVSDRFYHQCPPKPFSPDMTDVYEYWELPLTKQYDHFYHVPTSSQFCLLYDVSSGPEQRRFSRYTFDVESIDRLDETNSSEFTSAINVPNGQICYNTLGHMKIDYSSNWKNLDKYICHL